MLDELFVLVPVCCSWLEYFPQNVNFSIDNSLIRARPTLKYANWRALQLGRLGLRQCSKITTLFKLRLLECRTTPVAAKFDGASKTLDYQLHLTRWRTNAWSHLAI
jgi:hypothetical protein